ncbi:MAG: serine/threonine-protein kinase [Bryobacteraceae bacterium]|jgi:serine/threonine-protein kinase
MDRIGRYKIVRELGRGAMGVVYHAIDPNIGRPVAIKTIQLAGARAPDEQARLRERLFREARSAGILSHPGIVTIYDVEQQGDLAYIAMEFVDGPTLDQLLSAPEPLAPARVFAILGQTAAALDYAHQKGIVHRDIKPANIMIAADGTAKISDFGIAKITASEQFTMTGSIVGTPHYMSPEQVQGQSLDGRSDQFSLAVIAFEILTGEKPYTGEHLTTVVYKIVAEEPEAPHRLNASLNGAIESVLKKGLSKKPDGRYRTCQEFVDALEKACEGVKNFKTMARGGSLNEPTVAESAGAGAAPTLPPARRARRGETTVTRDPEERRKSGFLPFLAAILLAAALLALIGWQAGGWHGRPSVPESGGAGDSGQPAQPPQASAAQPANPAGEKPSPMPSAAPSAAAAPAATSGTQPVSGSSSPAPPAGSTTEPARQPGSAETATPSNPAPSAPASAAARPARHPSPSASARASAPLPQPVTVISSPSGATATLDGRSETACKTPCELDALPGQHSIYISMPGYQIERRDATVADAPLELAAVVLHANTGTLMLSSAPPGAAIRIDGKTIAQVTPAQLSLAPGTYRVTVEKNGASKTTDVDIRNDETKLLRVLLGQ